MVDFDAMAATWDDQPRRRERARRIAEAVRGAVPLRADMHALEIGAGTGILSRSLAAELGSVTVTDASGGMVEAATAALNDARFRHLTAMRLDVEADPLPEERFDLIMSQMALHHMGDVAAVIRRLFEIAAPGAWIALVDLDHDEHGDFHSHMDDFHGHHGFHRSDIARWLGEAGFVDVATSTALEMDPGADHHHQRFPLFLAVGRKAE